jgi:RNA polymerase sigma-70 factor (sigma-E family)
VIRTRRDKADFRGFVSAFSPTLLRAAYLLLRDRDAAEDAVQTTLLRTFRRWGRAKSAPEAYSRRVLVNVCRDDRRHQRRHPVQTASEGHEAPDAAVWPTERVEQRLVLEHALGALSAQQREVLVLRFFLDLSVPQTAELLDMPEGTVKSATHRGLSQLRELLSDQPHTEVHHAD